jgi:hypothetical protein
VYIKIKSLEFKFELALNLKIEIRKTWKENRKEVVGTWAESSHWRPTQFPRPISSSAILCTRRLCRTGMPRQAHSRTDHSSLARRSTNTWGPYTSPLPPSVSLTCGPYPSVTHRARYSFFATAGAVAAANVGLVGDLLFVLDPVSWG